MSLGGSTSDSDDGGIIIPDALYRAVQPKRDDDPALPPNTTRKTTLLSTTAAGLALLKGNIGPGILNLPRAFALTGYGLGSILFVGIAAQGIYSMWLLIQCHNYINNHNRRLTFMAVAQSALGRTGGRIVEVFLFVLQGGVCCVFLSLISTNLDAALSSLSNTHAILIVALYMGITATLRNIHDLFYLNALANICMVLAIATAIVAGFSHAKHHAVFAKPGISSVVLFTSDLFFAFEGIGLVMPIENAYDHSNNMFSFSFILVQTMGLVALAFGLTGVAGSIGFDVKSGSITAFLRQEYPDVLWYSIVNGLVIVAVAMTFPLQLAPAAQVLEEWLDKPSTQGGDFNSLDTSENSTAPIPTVDPAEDADAEPKSLPTTPFTTQEPSEPADDEIPVLPVATSTQSNYTWLYQRWGMVAIFTIIVLTVNDLSLLVGLFGAVGQTGLAGMPCAIHLALQYQGRAPRCFWMSALDVLILSLTTIVMISGCIVSFRQILSAV